MKEETVMTNYDRQINNPAEYRGRDRGPVEEVLSLISILTPKEQAELAATMFKDLPNFNRFIQEIHNEAYVTSWGD